jgi:hypothetical protein
MAGRSRDRSPQIERESSKIARRCYTTEKLVKPSAKSNFSFRSSVVTIQNKIKVNKKFFIALFPSIAEQALFCMN